MKDPRVHVLWKYDHEMQICFGVFATFEQAVSEWHEIRRSHVHVSRSGDISVFFDEDFTDGTWFVDTYTPGEDPVSTTIPVS
jgi:hypothetical protein